MEVNLSKREIVLENNCTADELNSRLKELWVKEAKYAAIHFPMKMIGPDDYEFVERWKFGNVESHHKVISGKVSFNRPERPMYPIAPQDIVLFPKKVFVQPILFDEILRNVPPGVPMAAVRLRGLEDGSVELSVPGMWPNPDLKKDKERHARDVERWVESIHEYQHDLRLWYDVMMSMKQEKGCCI